MEHILKEITLHQEQFARLPFFKFLEQGHNLEDSKIFVPGLAFFILTFQDILRLNEQQITEPNLVTIFQQHRQEDLGHDIWFLHDASQLGADCNASILFSDQFAKTRDASFEIMSEIFRASDDRIRLIIPLTLEATGHVFFSRVYQFFARTGYQGKLKYFSQEHFQIENAHEMYEHDINEKIQSIQLTDELRDEAMAVIQRIFSALSAMLCALHTQIESQQLQLI